jgi:hypothetical protein
MVAQLAPNVNVETARRTRLPTLLRCGPWYSKRSNMLAKGSCHALSYIMFCYKLDLLAIYVHEVLPIRLLVERQRLT